MPSASIRICSAVRRNFFNTSSDALATCFDYPTGPGAGLDSGCGDYERLWSTTSLRGMVVGDLRVEVLNEGVHSGDARQGYLGAGGFSTTAFRELTRISSSSTRSLRPRVKP